MSIKSSHQRQSDDQVPTNEQFEGRWVYIRKSQLIEDSSRGWIPPLNSTVADSPMDNFSTLQDYKSFLKASIKEFHSQFTRTRGNPSLKVDDFELLKTLDYTDNAKIVMALSKSDKLVYALKCTNKEMVVDNEDINGLRNELSISMSVKFRFLLSTMDYFMDNSYIYSLKPFLPGGSLLPHIKYLGYFEEKMAVFCAAQVALALEYLHNIKIAHRDIKPESVIMDYRGYVRLGNFRNSKVINDRTFSLCGTPAYVAPEVLVKKGHGCSADWWSFGALVYEMCSGYPPFSGTTFDKTLEQILKGRFRMKEWFSSELSDLLTNLLTPDTTKRLGGSKSGASDVKNHRWFAEINWLALLNKKSPSPYIPSLMSPMDASLFGHLPEEPLFIEDADRFRDYFTDF